MTKKLREYIKNAIISLVAIAAILPTWSRIFCLR